MRQEKTAVILVNHDGLRDTREAVESIKKQQMALQIIIVDNASPGNDADKLEKEFKDVKIIRAGNNLGFAGGNNLGMEYALENGFDYILLLNNDTKADKEMIMHLLAEADETTVTVPAMYYDSEPGTLWYGGGMVNKWTGNVEHLSLTEKQICSFATGCCMLIHRSIVERVGRMSEQYFMYCEDMDYSIRLGMAGVRIMYVPHAKLWHKIGKSSGGNTSAFSIYYITRNRLFCIKKHVKYFRPTAFWYAYLTRLIRMFQLICRGKPEWKAYRKALHDYHNGIMGRQEADGMLLPLK